MAIGLIGVKVGMTQVYDEKGECTPVTVLQVGPCPILQVRNAETDGYHALQLGFQDKPRRIASKAERGHVSADLESKRRLKGGKPLGPKANCEPQRYVREFRLDEAATQAVGQILTATEIFTKVKKKNQDTGAEYEDYPNVDVIGFSKGRGFAGNIKRHNFGGLRHSHGVKKGWRQHGSIASNASNRGSGRPKKGIRMAGRYGNSQVTIRNLRLVKIDADRHLMLVCGAVPGPNGGLVMIRATNKN
jgi:large subunit ribosomal protein L3